VDVVWRICASCRSSPHIFHKVLFIVWYLLFLQCWILTLFFRCCW
jgi:hypothetical protein